MNRTLLQVFFAFSILAATAAQAADSVSLYPIQTIAGGPGGGGDVGQYSRLAHDPAGGQHVVYYDATYGDLKYAHRLGNNQPWTVGIVDSSNDSGRWCALAIGAASETTGTANMVNGSRTVEVTSGTTPTSVIAGGQFRLEPGGTWQTVAGVDPERRRIELTDPYAGPSASNAPYRIRFYQPTITYQGKASFGSTLRVARPGDAGNWNITDVDPATTPTTPSHAGFETGVAVDSVGRIHVVYQDRTTSGASTGQLRYAKFDGLNWTFDVPVRDENVSGADRIAIDATDHVWVFCRDSSTNELLALQPTTGSWLRTVLDAGGRPGLGLDAMFAPSLDEIYVSSQNRPEGSQTAALRLNNGDATSPESRVWAMQPLGDIPSTGNEFTSVAAGNTTGTQQVVYYDSLSARLMLRRPTSPTSLILDAGPDVGRYPSAGVSPFDNALYATYYDSRAMALKMARNTGTSDTELSYIDGVKAGVYSDIGFTSTEVIAAYYNASECSLHVARWPRSGIPSDGTDVVVDASSANVGEYVSMAIDKDDRIFIAYYDRVNTKLRMAVWNLAEWLTTDVGNISSTSYGEYCKLAIDPTGTKLAIACRDAEHLNIAGVTASIPALLAAPLTINFEPLAVSSDTEIGRFLSLAWSASGEIYLSFFNDKTFSPMWSTAGTTATTAETIEHAALNIAGWFTSIAITPDNRPAVAYHDVTHGSLKYAERNGPNQWTITTLAESGVTGMYPILKFDYALGEQYVVYYDQTAAKLMLRSKPISSSVWREPMVLATGTRGIRPAASLDSDGLLYLGFYYQVGGDLLFMKTTAPPIFNAAGGWQSYK